MTLFAVLFGGLRAIACTCDSAPTVDAALAQSDAVFVGTVISGKLLVGRRGDPYARVFTFAVVEAYKGVAESNIEVQTGIGWGDCGLDFLVGRKYLVYACNDTWGGRGQTVLQADICTRTAPCQTRPGWDLDPDSDPDIEFLRRICHDALSRKQGIEPQQ